MLATLCCMAEGKEPTDPLPPVPAAIKSGDLLRGRVDARAKVYFLFSASSRDDVCLVHGAELAKIYREMKGKGAELILLSKDTPAEVQRWAKKHGLRCPILPDAKRSAKLPFPYTGEHIPPYLVALDAHGRKMAEANHDRVLTMLREWHQLVADIQRETDRKNDD